ncbi:MAG: GNAT family N-acetyltransferase [Proteobacteria bacterium]|jgi:D-alanine-D-alanine ligase-like ATP-grasp enzyme/GNAT superfamily N-acetyltransferase|nr:GNAT family N-acetyltransferase [Pseudomonadota bacterium]
MRVAVLHSAIGADAGPDELDTLVQVEAISKVLEAAGHEVVAIPAGLDLAAVKAALTAVAPGLVCNLVESMDGTGRLIHLAPALVERLGLPMTGCPSDGIYATSNKLVAKQILHLSGLPVPGWYPRPASKGDGPAVPPGKLIVKSLWEHASVGLEESSVIEPASEAALIGELARRRALLGGEAFAEQFVDGRELNLSVLEGPGGPRVLPPAEIRFVDFPKDKPRIVGYRAKWDTRSFEYEHTVRSFEFPPEDAPLLAALEALALRAFEVFRLRGYARVDFRVAPSGAPFILEVNANPCLSPDAGFAAAACRAGIGYDALVLSIAGIAAGDLGKVPPPGKPRNAAIRATPDGRFREGVTAEDRGTLEALLRGTGFFSDAEVGVALELVDAFVAEGTKSGYHFLVCEQDGEIAGFSCYGPIPGTASSFDLYWIAVHRRQQRKGLGKIIQGETEARVRALGGTRVYAETSGRDLYRPTRAFYERSGFAQEARIRNYYGPGDDQVIYGKVLG